MNFNDYRAIDAVNWSSIRDGLDSGEFSLKRYEAAKRAGPREATDKMLVGTATHCAVLEPHRLPLTVAVWEGGVRRGKAWEDFCDVNAGRAIIKIDDYLDAVAISNSVRAHPEAAKILERGEAEQVLRWVDKVSGLDMKARLDWIRSPHAFADLKTTRTINLRRFSAGAWASGIFHQMALYRRGMAARAEVSREAIVCEVIAVENTTPFDVMVSEVDPESLDAADVQLDEWLSMIAGSRKTGEYPGLYPGRQVLRAPRYALPDEGEGGFEVLEEAV